MRREVLVGREVELVELTALLDRGQLVTLTGPGGVGKTTLAVELASSHTDRRVVFVDLAGVEEPSGVEPAVAAAMGQQWFGSIDASTFPDEALVVVDNCEHVLDAAAAAITELRTVLRGLTVCATSRVPLGLRDEFVVPIAPLGVPARELVDAHAPAVELFAAVAARAGAPIADDDLAAVCELCRRVDGIPLAIEIVATRTRSMSVAELLERLGDRLDTIGQGGFRRDERQRSVRDTVEWSYHLLDPHERRLFDRLGVHPGRFSAAMAHTVADDGPFDDTLDRLDRLVGTSLAVATRGADGATWYHQLHAVRACALDHLVSAGELDVTTERLVDHMVAQARNLAAHTERGWTAETFAAITALLDGFLHALRWAVEHDDSPDRAFELLTVLWGHQSRTDEVLAVGRRVLDRWPTTDHPRWADAAATVATCLWIRRELDDADALVERALPGADTAAFAPVLLRRVRGQVRREQGRVDDALASLSDAADAARHRGLTALVVDAELLRAALSTSVGDVDGALAICSRVRELAADGPIAEVLVLTVEADALLRTDPAAAVELARTGRELATRTSYSAAAVGFGRTSAIGLALTGDLPGAASELSESIGEMTRSGSLAPAGALLEAAAVIAHRAGRDDWRELARAVAASPAVQLVDSSAGWLPEPEATPSHPPDLAGALALTDRVLADIAAGVPAAATADAAVPGNDRAPRSVPRTDPDVAPANRWELRGEHWEVTFDANTIIVRHAKGLDDLAQLLAAPDTEIAAIDLMGAAVTSSDTGELIDAAARRRYEDRVRELQSDLVDAENDHDLGRVEMITTELDTLVEHLAASVGIGRRTRRSGATTERARSAVTRRIRKAISQVGDLHPTLGRHLEASVRTGTYCAYRPERPTGWTISR